MFPANNTSMDCRLKLPVIKLIPSKNVRLVTLTDSDKDVS